MSSRVRNYFSEGSAPNKARCKTCKKEVSRGKIGNSAKWGTTSQRNHLRDNHPEIFKELLEQEQQDKIASESPSLNTYLIGTVPDASSAEKNPAGSHSEPNPAPPAQKQLSLQQSLNRNASWKNGENFLEANSLLAEWLCCDMLPYSTVASERFRTFVRFLRPEYKMPSEFFFRCTLIPEIYRKLKIFVKNLLEKQVEYCSATLDMWTSDANNAYFSTTVHFINNRWEQIVAFLGIKHFPGRHTGENVAKMLESVSLVGSFSFFFLSSTDLIVCRCCGNGICIRDCTYRCAIRVQTSCWEWILEIFQVTRVFVIFLIWSLTNQLTPSFPSNT